MSALVIITGASSGIGKATAQIFLQQGLEVVNISRRPCPLAGVKNFAIDLSSSTLKQSLPAIFSKLPQKIHLIHNAAIFKQDTVTDLSAAELEHVLRVNVIAPQTLNAWALPFMGPGSSIIYVGSTLAHKAVASAASYITSKHALLGLMRSTCQDLAGRKIHTSMICPGLTDTEMLKAHVGGSDEVLQQLGSQQTYENRLVQPQEVAQIILHATIHPVLNGSVIDANLGQLES